MIPVLLVSTGRTGTKYLANLIAGHSPDALVYHTSPHSTVINLLCNAHLAGWAPRSLVVGAWRVLKGREMPDSESGASHFVDSNNHLYAIARLAPELYPGLRVVHVVRDPRTYVRSHLNWARHRPKSFVANYLLPFWQPSPFMMGEMPWHRSIGFTKFEHFCWIWEFKNRLMEGIAQGPVPYHRARFEDLLGPASAETHINRLLEFMRLPPLRGLPSLAAGAMNSTEIRTFPAWPEWSDEQCLRLELLCGDRMRGYGYGEEPQWIERLDRGRLARSTSGAIHS